MLRIFAKKCSPLTSSYIPYRDFGNTIKKKFEEAVMKDVDSDSLKCLVFIAGLTDSSHSEMRLRLSNRLNRMDGSEPLPVSDDFINECETFVLRSDNRTMEQKEVKAAHRKQTMAKKWRPSRSVRLRKDSFSRKQLPKSKSHSDSHKQANLSRRKTRINNTKQHRCKQIALTPQDSRTFVNVCINGKHTRLQFDTGADITTISRKTWNLLDHPS
ncbi:hypothetical protein GCK32_002503 [Trichostrongylus colubriformis]|uniref:Peptidase A2 domain-containing protein n=1 Tax=Trichostrongylus colubriformis TaxID=6319 RepID=A0AAN8FQN8_TRICO